MIETKEAPRAEVLVVDDTPENLRVLCGMLKHQGYRARPMPSGKLALQSVASQPPDLILLDINMPEMNGYEVCRYLKENQATAAIPVIFISALADLENKVRAFSSGGVDYITKPFQFEEVEARVETHLKLRRLQLQLEQYARHLEDKVEEKVREISQSQMATIEVLAQLAESRDECTGGHIKRIQTLSRALALKLGESERYQRTVTEAYVTNIYHASALHDIGKVGVKDAILLKNGPLTAEEFTAMKKHTIYAAHTLAAARDRYPGNVFINMGIAIARSHHEKWDGNGYPDGLAGEDIPLCARIMALADVYDALRAKRPYKDGMSHEDAREIIIAGSGTHFDPDVVEAFLEIEQIFKEQQQ